VQEGGDKLKAEAHKLVLYCASRGVKLGRIGNIVNRNDPVAQQLYEFKDGGNDNAIVLKPVLFGDRNNNNQVLQGSINDMSIKDLIISCGVADTLTFDKKISDAKAIQVEIDRAKVALGL
jgi:hypothetical protein